MTDRIPSIYCALAALTLLLYLTAGCRGTKRRTTLDLALPGAATRLGRGLLQGAKEE